MDLAPSARPLDYTGGRRAYLTRYHPCGLKKNALKPWQHQSWCLAKLDAAFIAAMEDVLDLYAAAPDPARPVISLDEKLVTLHADTRPPLPVAPGHGERVDYEYQRVGTANLFVALDLHAHWRHVRVTDRRTKLEYAHLLQWLADECYPEATVIRLVQDNLNTHHLASLYLAFPPEEARRLAQRFEVHYTPKHGSWLNLVEIEIGIIERQCLRHRVESADALRERLRVWEQERNTAHIGIQWRFTTPDARTKFQRFYAVLLVSEQPKPES